MGEAMIPLLLGLAFIGVTLARSVWLWRTTGLNPYVIDHHDPLSRFVAHVFAIVVGAVFVYCAVLAFWPQAEQALGLVTWVAGEATRWAGGTLMVCAICGRATRSSRWVRRGASVFQARRRLCAPTRRSRCRAIRFSWA
jgi:hypothetical protein